MLEELTPARPVWHVSTWASPQRCEVSAVCWFVFWAVAVLVKSRAVSFVDLPQFERPLVPESLVSDGFFFST